MARVFLITATALAGVLLVSGLTAQTLSLPATQDSRKIAVLVAPGITHTRQLPSAELRRLRKRMVSGAAMREADLRRLADARDGLAAQRLVKRLSPRGLAADASDIAFYASIAAGAGRTAMFDDFVGALYRLDPASEPKRRVRQYIRVLYPHAWAGNPLAEDALFALNGRDRLFGPMSEATRARILREGSALMLLALAMRDLAGDDLGTAGLTRVAGYLELADRRGNLPIRAMARSLRQSTAARLAKEEETR